MSLLVVGSVALDSIFTPFGETADALGGSAVFFSVAGSILHPVRVVGVVGRDYPVHELDRLAARGIDWSGVERADGESFRWKGKYSYDLQSRETLETRLGVFAHFQPKLPAAFRDAQYLFLGNIDPELQLGVLEQVPNAKLVACDTMPGAVFQKIDDTSGDRWFGPSVDLTFHLFAPMQPGWILGHNRARHAGDGYASVDMALWDGATGTLVAYATQLMFFAFMR